MRVQVPNTGWCMGVAEIAQRIGKPRNVVAQWVVRGKLPEPDARLAMGPVWREETIEAWLTERG